MLLMDIVITRYFMHKPHSPHSPHRRLYLMRRVFSLFSQQKS